MTSRIDDLFQRLGSANSKIRNEALNELARLADAGELVHMTDAPTLELVLDLLADERCVIRQQASRVLSKIASGSDARTLERLLTLLPWLEAKLVLGKIGGPQAVEPLLRMLRDPDLEIRRQAASALSHLRDASVFPALVSMLSDPLPDVQSCGAMALEMLNDPRAIEPLLEHNMLDSVRSICGALAHNRDVARKYPTIVIPILLNEAKSGSYEPMRLTAAKALVDAKNEDIRALLPGIIVDWIAETPRLRKLPAADTSELSSILRYADISDKMLGLAVAALGYEIVKVRAGADGPSGGTRFDKRIDTNYRHNDKDYYYRGGEDAIELISKQTGAFTAQVLRRAAFKPDRTIEWGGVSDYDNEPFTKTFTFKRDRKSAREGLIHRARANDRDVLAVLTPKVILDWIQDVYDIREERFFYPQREKWEVDNSSERKAAGEIANLAGMPQDLLSLAIEALSCKIELLPMLYWQRPGSGWTIARNIPKYRQDEDRRGWTTKGTQSIRYDGGMKAVEKLCRRDGIWSDEILRRVAEKKDLEDYHWDLPGRKEWRGCIVHLKFKTEREMAQTELNRRAATGLSRNDDAAHGQR